MVAQVQFVLAPVLANDGIMDYTTPEGAKLYQAGIEVLPGNPFNCEPHGIKVFLATLEDQVIRCSWMHHPDDPTRPPQA